MAIATVNPATGETMKRFDEITDEELDARLERASMTFSKYRLTSFEQRSGWMLRAAQLLDSEQEAVARTLTTEMGKTVKSARAEAAKCSRGFRYYAEHAQELLADEPADAAAVGAGTAYARYQPLGPVLAIMPWNFPLWQVVRFAAPSLMAGNVGLLKHASNVPQTALYLGELFERAGFPAGGFQALLMGSARVERVIRDKRVAAVTLTGSGPAGAAVGALAGEMIKPSILELGGSDPFIVMPSADIEAAARVATTARCQNNGQSCIAAKRFIVHKTVAEEFEKRFVGHMSALKVGDPLDEATDVGPLATSSGRDDVEELVADALSKGAKVLCGGKRLPRPGWFYPPTVLTGLTPQMRVYSEEAFGPVAGLYRVGDIEEAITLANGTEFGLGANAWTNDAYERARFIDELESGAVFINGMVTSYPELPFGGVKTSGYGRELAAPGIRAFCNLKTVWLGA
ncbi:MAG TPA: NADP-dependent succinic semialdehyde dehydrogenase [Acidimicrobiales bacterium]|nr:NADP-dependent succinic semialdehyde dehydrogenase [Acidimicrobiales bacterium]